MNKITKIIIPILVLALVLPVLTLAPFEASPQPEISDGSGTVGNPYEISNLTELNEIRANLSAHYILTSNIDARETETWNDGDGWIPIGNEEQPFEGSFDGQAYTISNLYINRPEEDHVGLFGASRGTIEKVGLEGVNITGNYYVGGIVGALEGPKMLSPEVVGHVSRSFVKGTVTGENHVGGIAGHSRGGSIEKTYSRTEVTTREKNAGGIAGTLEPNIVINPSIIESYSTGTITQRIGELDPTDVTIGGLVGNGSSNFVLNSVWDTETSETTTSAGGKGLTTEEMKDIINYVDREWEAQYTSGPEVNEGYPVLHWEQSPRSPTWYLSGYQGHNVTLDVTGEGNITKNTETLTVPDTQEYERGSKITLTAEPAEGYQFWGWHSNIGARVVGASENTTFMIKYDDEEINAVFVAEIHVSLAMGEEAYLPGETVEVTITNEGEEGITLSNTKTVHPHTFYRYEEGKWEEIGFYDPLTDALQVPDTLESGKNYTYTWDQTEYFYRDGEYVGVHAKPGQYKVEWFNESIEFTIEEIEGYVQVTTNKNNYEVGEEVQITIRNTYSETISLSRNSPAIPDAIKDIIENQEVTFYDPDSNFMQVPIELGPEEEVTYIWDQKEYNSTGEQVEPGEYSVTWYNEETSFNILSEGYHLTINVEGQGTTDPEEGTHIYGKDEEVTVTADPAEGWEFVEWTGDCSGTTCTVTMDENRTVTAVFQEESIIVTPITAASGLTYALVIALIAIAIALYTLNKKKGK